MFTPQVKKQLSMFFISISMLSKYKHGKNTSMIKEFHLCSNFCILFRQDFPYLDSQRLFSAQKKNHCKVVCSFFKWDQQINSKRSNFLQILFIKPGQQASLQTTNWFLWDLWNSLKSTWPNWNEIMISTTKWSNNSHQHLEEKYI